VLEYQGVRNQEVEYHLKNEYPNNEKKEERGKMPTNDQWSQNKEEKKKRRLELNW